MAPVRTERKIVILLTDANPNDSMPLSRLGRLPCPMRRRTAWRMPPPRWQDFAAPGCRVGAVFFGSSGNYPNAEKIYGRQLVRIRQMEEFSKAAVELIRMECEQ